MDMHQAIQKMEAARDLLVEAYHHWPTAEIRLSREQLEERIDLARELAGLPYAVSGGGNACLCAQRPAWGIIECPTHGIVNAG